MKSEIGCSDLRSTDLSLSHLLRELDIVILIIVVLRISTIVSAFAFQIQRRAQRTIITGMSNLNASVHIRELYQRSAACQLPMQTSTYKLMACDGQAELIGNIPEIVSASTSALASDGKVTRSLPFTDDNFSSDEGT